MLMDLFFPGPKLHLRQATAMLREAHMARLEHQAAGEHHSALAKMYAERAKRLEREVQQLQVAAAGDQAVMEPVLEQPVLYALQGSGRQRAQLPK